MKPFNKQTFIDILVCKKNFLLITLALVAFQSIFCGVMQQLGYTGPLSIFIPMSDDPFADLIKVALGYAKSGWSLDGWPEIFKSYYTNNPYKGLYAVLTGGFSHFHLPPLTTYIGFLR